MAVDIVPISIVASAVKFLYLSAAGQVYNTNTPAYENWTDGNYSHYGVSATQQGTSPIWEATRPAGVTVPFSIIAMAVVGGTPSTDILVGSGMLLMNSDAAGNPNVNVAEINQISTSSVTTVNPNIGETQPLNFTGTGGSALVQVDTRDFLGNPVILDANNLPEVDVQDWSANPVSWDSGGGAPDVVVANYASGRAPPTTGAIAAAVLTDTTDLTTPGSLGYTVGHAPSWFVFSTIYVPVINGVLSGNILVQPLMVQNIIVPQYSTASFTWPAFVDGSGNPINLSGKLVEFVAMNDVKATIVHYDTTNQPSNIAISGASNNIVTVTFAATDTVNSLNKLVYTIWIKQTSPSVANTPLATGNCNFSELVTP